MFEVEKKAHLTNPEGTLQTIRNLPNVKYEGTFYKSDLYFTQKYISNFQDIQNQNKIFRVRYIGQKIYWTLKYKSFVDCTEVNKEYEVLISPEYQQKVVEFLEELEVDSSAICLEEIWELKTTKQWIDFWTSLGFFFFLAKEKKTELFTLLYQTKKLSLEWNEITGLGFFIEIEGLTSKENEVASYIEAINSVMQWLYIPPNMEEPKLYLELLYQKQHLEPLP